MEKVGNGKRMSGKLAVITIIVAAAVVAAGVIYWFYGPSRRGQAPVLPSAGPAAEEPKSLGAEIAESVESPIENKLPAVSPVVNPLEGAYKNPFE